MLYEQVEKREKEACGGVTTVTGSCKKGKINITPKGIVKVARTKTDTSTYEA